MSFVSTGFASLNNMLAGGSDCRGFPRGQLTILNGGAGSGKSQVLKKCCERAHDKKLNVRYLTSEEYFQDKYPVVKVNFFDEVRNLMASLLHPGSSDKVDLLVIDSLSHLALDAPTDTDQLAGTARRLGVLFRRDFGQTAVVCTVQSKRVGGGISVSSEVAHTSSVILGISKTDGGYLLDLLKSRISVAGVSCLIRPTDMDDFDRSNIPTRYQRILRG